jgi:transcriptional regulator with XRE-family HTH domain
LPGKGHVDRQQLANQPYALAVRRAREAMRLTQAEFAERMAAELGYHVGKDQVGKWEAGVSLEGAQYRWTTVPAWALGAAARISGRSPSDLLSVDDGGLAARVAQLEERTRTLEVLMARLRAAGLLPSAGEGAEDQDGTDAPAGGRST